MKFKKLLILVALTIVIAGCAQKNVEKNLNLNKPQVFFYYETGCPNCKMIEPYIKLLKKEYRDKVDFHLCNWDNHTNWSALEKKVYSETNPYGFPALVFINKNEKKVFIGWYAIGENFTSYLRKMGYNPPKAFYNKTSYNAAECLNCHAKRHIPPPSKYNCTYCCHMGNKTNNKTY